MINKVILWANGMVMVFNEKGQQLPEYQGRTSEVLSRILKDAPPTCQFQEGNWGQGRLRDIDRPREEEASDEEE